MIADSFEIGLKESLHEYVKSVWNQLDLLSLFLFWTGLPLFSIDPDVKVSHQHQEEGNEPHGPLLYLHETGRIFLVLSLLLYIIRLLNIFTVHKLFGPKLIMLGKMVQINLYYEHTLSIIC